MREVRVRGWVLAPLLVALIMLAPWPEWLIEDWYSRDVFPRIQGSVTSLSNLTSFAVIDIGLAALALFLGVLLLRVVRSEAGWAVGLWEALRRAVRLAALLALAFLILWGLNYRRIPLEASLGGRRTGAPVAGAVAGLAHDAARSASALRVIALDQTSSFEQIASRLEPSFQKALQRLKLPPLRVAGRPKVSRVLTPFFTAAGVTGMVNPIALESIVHPDLLPFERPMVLAHEWAHLAGYADEADASAVAWLACVTGDADLAYSAHMFVVLETAAALPAHEWQAVRARLSPGVLVDIEALATRLERQRPAVREQAFRVYDGYLKSNRVDDGVRSYSRVIRVLLTPGMRAAVSPLGAY